MASCPGRQTNSSSRNARSISRACTIEETGPVYACLPVPIWPVCLVKRGFHWTPASNGLFVPFLDGSSIQLYDDDARCEAEIRKLSPNGISGWRAMSDVIRRLRDALRPGSDRDLWIAMPLHKSIWKSESVLTTRPAIYCSIGRWPSSPGAIFRTKDCRLHI